MLHPTTRQKHEEQISSLCQKLKEKSVKCYDFIRSGSREVLKKETNFKSVGRFQSHLDVTPA